MVFDLLIQCLCYNWVDWFAKVVLFIPILTSAICHLTSMLVCDIGWHAQKVHIFCSKTTWVFQEYWKRLQCHSMSEVLRPFDMLHLLIFMQMSQGYKKYHLCKSITTILSRTFSKKVNQIKSSTSWEKWRPSFLLWLSSLWDFGLW